MIGDSTRIFLQQLENISSKYYDFIRILRFLVNRSWNFNLNDWKSNYHKIDSDSNEKIAKWKENSVVENLIIQVPFSVM